MPPTKLYSYVSRHKVIFCRYCCSHCIASVHKSKTSRNIVYFAGYHHPHCTEIEDLQAELEQMPGTCGPPNGTLGSMGLSGSMGGTGSRSNRSRRGSSRIERREADTIDMMDPSKEKTVNFANCVSPPSPHDPGFMGINNESYPCDCCQIDETAFRRSYSQQLSCGPSGMMQFSEVGKGKKCDFLNG